jgi:hypothetical protein
MRDECLSAADIRPFCLFLDLWYFTIQLCAIFPCGARKNRTQAIDKYHAAAHPELGCPLGEGQVKSAALRCGIEQLRKS